MLIGYARVSKADGSQSLDLQRDALRAAGIDAVNVYHDFASGVRDDRPGLDSCLRALRKGDVLVVWKLDRLGRNLAHLVNTVQDLSARGVGLRVLAGQGAQIDTTTAAGRLVFGIFAALAEFERELIRERTVAGQGRTGPRTQGRQEVRAVESPGAAGSGRDGPPRHVGVRTVPRTRHQAGSTGPYGERVCICSSRPACTAPRPRRRRRVEAPPGARRSRKQPEAADPWAPTGRSTCRCSTPRCSTPFYIPPRCRRPRRHRPRHPSPTSPRLESSDRRPPRRRRARQFRPRRIGKGHTRAERTALEDRPPVRLTKSGNDPPRSHELAESGSFSRLDQVRFAAAAGVVWFVVVEHVGYVVHEAALSWRRVHSSQGGKCWQEPRNLPWP